MAKNIFAKGNLKNFRLSLRQYKKDKKIFPRCIGSFHQREKILLNTKWTSYNQQTFKYLLIKEKTLLNSEKIRFDNLKLSLDKKN